MLAFGACFDTTLRELWFLASTDDAQIRLIRRTSVLKFLEVRCMHARLNGYSSP